MDEGEWTAAGLFSPSKARIAQAQARDWSYVEAWLAKKYSAARIPAIERNEDTLQALLLLIASNDAADEQRNAVDRLERSALQHLTKHNADGGNLLFKNVNDHLDGDATVALDCLAESAIALDVPARAGNIRLTAAAASLQLDAFEARQSEDRARVELDVLQAEVKRLSELLNRLQSDKYQPQTTLSDRTSEWMKGSKMLREKLVEYEERTAVADKATELSKLLEEARRIHGAITLHQQKHAEAEK